MKVVSYTVLFLMALSVAGNSAIGAEVPSPYISLYEHRVNLAMAQTRRQEAETVFQAARVARARILVTKQAMSREEHERIEADHKKSLAEVEVANAFVAEAQAMLQVVRDLVQHGEAVPLCRL